jgi:hypothetical protein
MLVAVEGEEIRAGLLLHHSTLWLQGVERRFCWLGLPLSEGLVDPRHGMAIVHLMNAVLAREPFLMDLGIGSLEETAAKFLIQLGWRHATVPFLFHPVRMGEVIRRMPYLRSRRSHLGAKLFAGIGGAAALDAGLALLRRARRSRNEVTRLPRFEEWADRVYASSRGGYGAAVVRDAAALNVCYPPDDTRYVRLRIRRDTGEELGWVVVIQARMENNKYFGDLHVGTLVDGFGPVDSVPRLVQAGLEWLVDAGVDLIVANFSHRAWRRACAGIGFLPGPSNFFFFVSPAGNPMLQTPCPLSAIHLTRGDGDGPFNLMPPPVRAAPVG